MSRLAPLMLASLLGCSSGPLSGDDGTDGDTGDSGSAELVCDPSDATACGGGQGVMCCSDDPIAIDLADIDALVSPAYQGRGGEGTPVFSGANNPLSRSGRCVTEGSVIGTDALAEVNAVGCPVPCNPTWSASEVEQTCGPGRVCCQTRAVELEDCVLDPGLGDSGCWRPVRGTDINGFGGLDATTWAASSHATHQDPNGANCQLFVQGVPPDVLSANGISANELLAACFRRLSVANQRGFCAAPDDACPLAEPGYVDACEQRNLDEARGGC